MIIFHWTEVVYGRGAREHAAVLRPQRRGGGESRGREREREREREIERADPLVELHVCASCSSRTRYVVFCQEQFSLSLSLSLSLSVARLPGPGSPARSLPRQQRRPPWLIPRSNPPTKAMPYSGDAVQRRMHSFGDSLAHARPIADNYTDPLHGRLRV